MEKLARDDVHSTVDIKAVFKRLFGGFEKTQMGIKNASVKGQSRSTPKTPSNRRRCSQYIISGVSLDPDQSNTTPDQRSCLTSLNNSAELDTTQRPIQRNQRKYKRIALDDITNIARDEGLNTSTPKTPSNKCRCVLTKVTKSSEIKTTQRPIPKKQRKNICALLDECK
ncbi:unnamed protein product [Brassica oleracea]